MIVKRGWLACLLLYMYRVICHCVVNTKVEDVDKKFADLDKLKAAGWVVAEQSPAKSKPARVSTDIGSLVNSKPTHT